MDHSSLPFSILNERLRPHSTQDRIRAPPSIWEDRPTSGSHQRGSTSSSAMAKGDRSTVYQIPDSEPESEDSKARSDETAGEDSETGSLDSWSSMNEEQADRSDLLNLLNQCLVPAMRTMVPEPPGDGGQDGERSRGGQGGVGSPHTESIGGIPSITVETQQEADPRVLAGEVGEQNRRSYVDRSLPDLIRGSGKPLSRRRTLGPVSDTLKEVRREVELSRRRSIKLKAQVDKLQETSEGPGWSKHRERVTEEVLSILRLLRPLSEPHHSLGEFPSGVGRLDAALGQLQTVARTLAISHGQQPFGAAKRSEDRAILEQALRDRDEAIERKKGMEAELLRSKTEMMCLNNQLLEAVQKRLELSLELEAWKDDLQFILQQQLQQQQQSQQAAEQAQKKTRVGLLRRAERVPVQRLSSLPNIIAPDATTSAKQIFIANQTPSTPSAPELPPPASKSFPEQGFGSLPRSWKDKFRRGKTPDVQQASGHETTGFQTVSLE